MIQIIKQKALDLHKKYELRFEILFFIGGFIFDALLVTEIDDLFGLAQQAVYLLIIASILHHEIIFRLQKWSPSSSFTEKMWSYRNLLLHFLLGTLLNIYSLFYIKSASLIGSLLFLALMVGLIIANELQIVKKAKVSLKVALFAICLFSYISILYPIILGFLGWTPFGLSVITTLALFYLQFWILRKKTEDHHIAIKSVLFPGLSVLIVFIIFYFCGWIPPVPLSVKEQGIYHLIEKRDGHFLLSTERVWWKLWQSGDSDFKARPDDKIYFFAQIYSPARFSDQIFIQWDHKDPVRGWQKTDHIPLQIQGGRKEGFRGYAVKANYQPGDWRVIVETSMGHEISRLSFAVTEDLSTEQRAFRVLDY